MAITVAHPQPRATVGELEAAALSGLILCRGHATVLWLTTRASGGGPLARSFGERGREGGRPASSVAASSASRVRPAIPVASTSRN